MDTNTKDHAQLVLELEQRELQRRIESLKEDSDRYGELQDRAKKSLDVLEVRLQEVKRALTDLAFEAVGRP